MKIILFLRNGMPSNSKGDVNSNIYFHRLLGRVIEFLNAFDIAYEIYNRNTIIEKDDTAIILQDDTDTLVASNLVPGFCSPSVATKLLQKVELSTLTQQYGFDALPTRMITSVSDILEDDQFVLKAPLSQGNSDLTGTIPDSLLKWYPNRNALLAEQAAKEIDKLISTGVVIQRGVSVDGFNNFIGKQGCVNNKGEVYFTRTGDSIRPVTITRPMTHGYMNREYNIHTAVEEKIRALILDNGIKNTPINFQFLKEGDNYYPIDFNLRFSPYAFMWAEHFNPIENTRFLCHLFNISTDLPDIFESGKADDRGAQWSTYMSFT